MYVCALRPLGEPLRGADVFGPLAELRRRGESEPVTVLAGPFAAVAAESRALRPLLARFGDLTAAGDVRLDNRSELVSMCRHAVPGSISDLELVLRVIDAYGEQAIGRLLGDFAFVAWDARAQRLMAARDALGVKPLYYRSLHGTLLFAARMDLIATSGEYDLDHIADTLAGLASPEDRTIWAGVRPIPAGGCLLQRGTVAEGRRFWTSDAFTPDTDADPRERVEEFRTLFRDAVQARLGAPMTTWAQLSGGVDSSSIVAMAQDLYGGDRLAGTVTAVDSLGGGDERRYSDAIVRRYDLRNEQVHDYWAWQEDGEAPPATDGPRPLFPFFARDRRMFDVVRKAGGRVVLSGMGSDHYLMGRMSYLADMVANRRPAAALREVARWSIATRLSFWTLLRKEVIRPLLPATWRTQDSDEATPAWIQPAFARTTGLDARIAGVQARGDRPGELFSRCISRSVRSVASWVDRWPYDEGVEIRYPFLYRPLVEAGMRLPVSMRIRPETQKWVLREAMRGLLPEEVRTRNGKGTIDARILWSLTRERGRIDAMLRDPILAQLGCVDAQRLRAAVESARHGVVHNLVFLMSALSLETWLSVRSGTWTAPAAAATAA
jgi:asparagine synthase (glutamine-hydrolysing)